MPRHLSRLLASALLSTLLVACGGGGGGGSNVSGDSNFSSLSRQDGTATSGLDRFNYWRGQLGLTALTREPRLDVAAQGHSDYQAANGIISHYQDAGREGFTGECLGDSNSDVRCAPSKVSRLDQAGYTLGTSYAFGEVISRTASTDGSAAADALIAAIYHRFVIFEPLFEQAGAGAAQRPGGSTYFTTNFAVNGLVGKGLGAGGHVVYPYDTQSGVQRNFFSNQEEPDPVPSRNEVGYPISLHADITSSGVTVQRFTVRRAGGAELAVQQLWSAVDPNTPASAAAIIPLDVLESNTQYVVDFQGTVGGVPVNRSWTFTTGT